MPPGQERIRTLRACTACSARKVKCDGLDTCAACKKHGVTCVYVDSGKKRGPPKGAPARGGPKRRVAPDANGKPVAHPAPATAPDMSLMSEGARRYSGGSISTANGLNMSMSPPNGGTHSGAMPPPSSLDHSSMSVRIVTPPQKNQHTQGPSPAKIDSILGLDMETRSVEDGVLDFNHGLLSPATSRADTVALPRHPSISMPTTASSPSAAQSPSLAANAGLTEEDLDEMLLLYETFIHPHWPIIYLPALRSLRTLETQSPLVFDAILALAAANQDLNAPPVPERYPRSLYSTLSETLVESVRQRVLNSLGARDVPTIQALFLITLVDLGYGRMQFAYHMGGIACRMAIDLGLHTLCQPAGMPTHPPGRTEHEQHRTLWACFILDKILAAVLQRPPMMRSAVIDTPRPSTMERDELDLWLAGRASQYLQPHAVTDMECAKSHALTSFNALVDIMIILEDILDHVYRPSECRARIENPEAAGKHYDELVVGIDENLRAWRTNLPQHLQWNDQHEHGHYAVGPHVLTMRGWYYTCMLLVHRPRVPFLEAASSPHGDAAETLSRLSGPNTLPDASAPAHKRLPKGIDVSRDAASNICQVLEAYKRSFRVRKFPSVWVYMIFQAGTVHGGLAARPSPGMDFSPSLAGDTPLSPERTESLQRLEQCIRWLNEVAVTWVSASEHSEILRRISAVGAKTRPPSPHLEGLLQMTDNPDTNVPTSRPSGQNPNMFNSLMGTPSNPKQQNLQQSSQATQHSLQQQHGNVDTGLQQQNEDILNAWMLFWASMPTASDDPSLWRGFENMFTDNPPNANTYGAS